MSVQMIGQLGMLILVVLVFLRVPVAVAMGLVGFVGYALIPGLMLCLLYILVVVVLVRISPNWAPEKEERMTILARIRSLAQVWEIALLFVVVIGGLYAGLLTATQAAAVGAFGAWFLGVITRRLSWKDTREGVFATVHTTAMLFIILCAAHIFTYFVVLTQIPQGLVEMVDGLNLNPIVLLLLIGLFYLILGCFLEAFGMILITVPILMPLIEQAGFDPIWYGVFLVIMIETGMITPPVGMNIFVMQSQLPTMSLPRLYQSVLPFVLAPVFLAALIIFVPEIVTWLPTTLFD